MADKPLSIQDQLEVSKKVTLDYCKTIERLTDKLERANEYTRALQHQLDVVRLVTQVRYANPDLKP